MKNNRGFTLIEVIVASFIVGLFVSFAAYLLWINWASFGRGENLLNMQMQARNAAREISDNVRKCKSFTVSGANKQLNLTLPGSVISDYIYRFNDIAGTADDFLERSIDNGATYDVLSDDIDFTNSNFIQDGESVRITIALSAAGLLETVPSQIKIETQSTRRNR